MPWFRRRRALPQRLDVTCGGEFRMEVKGESFHQRAISAMADACGREVDGDRIRAYGGRVVLRREPRNEYDMNAVAVLWEGEPLGHLPRATAAELAELLDSLSAGNIEIWTVACVYGRRITNSHWNLGVWLDLPTPDELKEQLLASLRQG